MPSNDVNICKIKEGHPELLAKICNLQRELKELEQKYSKVKSDHEVFISSHQRAKSSFFAIMRPRLRKQNAATYLDRSALDRDLMILQRALRNKVPLEETYDWRLPSIIEEYKHGIVDPLRVQWTETHETVTGVFYSFYTNGYSTLHLICSLCCVFIIRVVVFLNFIPAWNPLIDMCLVSVCVLRFHSLRCEKYSFLLIVKVRISLNDITFHSIEIVFYRAYLSIYAFSSEASPSLFILTGKIKIECKVTAANHM